nr:12714_t:CDS:10 [Entrophospora candida]
MAEIKPKNIHTILGELQSLIIDIQEQYEVSTRQNTPIPNAIHPLGPVNLASVSIEFKEKIDLIKHIISKFRTSLIFEATAQHNIIVGLEQTIKRYTGELQEESNRLSPLTELHKDIKICKELALDACQDMGAAFKFVIQETVNLAKKFGLQVYELDRKGAHSTQSISGSIHLLDIQFNESINQINKVTITGQILATLETLSTNNENLDTFLCMRRINKDISSNTEGNISQILIEGHGIPLFHMDYIGPSIVYWAPKYKVIETDWNFVKNVLISDENNEIFKSFYRMWITMEESQTINKFLPIESIERKHLIENMDDESDLMNNFDIISDLQFPTLPNQLNFLEPKEKFAVVAPVKYVAWLEPPLFVADNIAREIGKSVGVINKDSFPIGVSGGFDNRDTQSLSLEELLSFDDSPYLQVYSLNSKSCCTSSKRIDRLPFTNPVQIYRILKLLRQQLVYNTLFQSCFNSFTYKPSQPKQNRMDVDVEGVSSRKLEIRFNVIDPPNKFSISFQPTNLASSSFIFLQITIQQDSRLLVTSQLTSNVGETILDDKKLTKVLEICQNIPMLIEWVLKALDKRVGEQYSHQ